MERILDLQELPAADGAEAGLPLVSSFSVVPPCPGWPSTLTTWNC
jgi:hypothetical protein